MMTVNMDGGLQNGPGQHKNSQDDEEALTSIMKDLAALRFCYQFKSNSTNKPKSRTPSYRQDLRVKLEHEREKRSRYAISKISLHREVQEICQAAQKNRNVPIKYFDI